MLEINELEQKVIKITCVVLLCLVTQSCPTLCDPMDYSLPSSSVLGGFSRQDYWSGFPCPPPGDLSNPGIEPRSPSLQVDSLPFEPAGKLKNTGVGSLSFLQGNFLSQESNQGLLLHCMWILYQLSYLEALRSHTKCKNPTSQHSLDCKQSTIYAISQCYLYLITPGIAGHMRTCAV